MKSIMEMTADYLYSFGFDFRNHTEEVLAPIYEKMEKYSIKICYNPKEDKE